MRLRFWQTETVERNGHRVTMDAGPWRAGIQTVTRVWCADYVARTAHMTGYPDSYSTVPACVFVKGKTVTGHIFVTSADNGEPVYRFTAGGKNKALIGEWS